MAPFASVSGLAPFLNSNRTLRSPARIGQRRVSSFRGSPGSSGSNPQSREQRHPPHPYSINACARRNVTENPQCKLVAEYSAIEFSGASRTLDVQGCFQNPVYSRRHCGNITHAVLPLCRAEQRRSRPDDVILTTQRPFTFSVTTRPRSFASSHKGSLGHDVRHASITSS